MVSNFRFKLPNGAERSPNVAWIRRERWEALTPEQRRKFPPLHQILSSNSGQQQTI